MQQERSSLSPMRATSMATALLSSILLLACGGRIDLDAQPGTSVEPDAGIPGDDSVDPTSEAGATTATTRDAGTSIPGLPDLSSLLDLDAGPIGACFSCAQTMCGTEVTACLSSSPCLQEGLCDVANCFGGAGSSSGTGGSGSGSGSSGGLLSDLSCFNSCGSDATASNQLSSALFCLVGSCSSSCLGAVGSLGSLGTSGGLGGLTPGLTGAAAPSLSK
ncbi:MAG TPA: hypothetical protein VHV30_15245 [Polyangiaceae bacterium]|jgi:hypothetical protein|nr:hypothetical protein [Polyangiaceae bacterium]